MGCSSNILTQTVLNIEKFQNFIKSYKIIINIKTSIINYNNMNPLKVFLISTKSIPKYVKIINDNLGYLNKDNDYLLMNQEIISKLSNYDFDTIKIFNDYQNCINIIKNKNDDKENDFIIVSEQFLQIMKIQFDNKKNVEITNDKNINKILIKFPISLKTIPFKERSFYSFQLEEPENFNRDLNKLEEKKTKYINYDNKESIVNPINLISKMDMLKEYNEKKNIQKNIIIFSDLIPLLYCFTNISSLVNYFCNKNCVLFGHSNKNISKEFSNIIINLKNKKWIENTINYNFFYKNIGDKEELYESNNLFLFLIQNLHNELNRYNINENVTILETNQMDLIVELNKCRKFFNKRNKSIISDTFYFEEIYRTRCANCETMTYNCTINYKFIFKLDEVLSFKLNNNNRNIENINIYDCFTFLTSIKQNYSFCQNCKKNIYCLTSYMINSKPEIITIFLDRNNVFENGIEFSIDFDFDLDNYLFKWDNSNANTEKYELIGILTYFGNELGSRRTAIFKSAFDNRWYCYKKSKVEIFKTFNYKGMPYLLFYQKKNHQIK